MRHGGGLEVSDHEDRTKYGPDQTAGLNGEWVPVLWRCPNRHNLDTGAGFLQAVEAQRHRWDLGPHPTTRERWVAVPFSG